MVHHVALWLILILFSQWFGIRLYSSPFILADALRDRIETSDLHGKTEFIWFQKPHIHLELTQNETHVLDTLAVHNGGVHICVCHIQQSYVCACPDIPDFGPCSTEPNLYDIDDDDENEDEDKPVVPITPPSNRNSFNNGDMFIKSLTRARNNSDIPSHIFIITIVLCVVAVAIIIIIIVIYVRRAHQKKYLYASGRSVLTFSNPNYNASSSDVGPNASQADKKPFLWKRLKYDKSQERVFNVHEDKQAASPEVVSLIPAVVNPNNCGDATTPERIATPPPTPPQRLDSISLKAG
ncbi:hypothetical protein L9F63_014187 [Diploptera punctata]|uniref:Uncharacterized protein n=1 Tax=Diploptera punctata TaxID=6984 RepID=A0AAD8A8E8_DIPPU|nr:hypothetical protein L9F63_014187 [Diploptera punctata]